MWFTRATNDSTLCPQYKVLRNKVTNELRNCVQQYYHTVIEENSSDPKEMWRTINKVLNKDAPSTSFTAVNFQGQILDRPNEKAEAFNEHFVTVCPKLASSIEQRPYDNPLKYLGEINENSLKFNFKQVDARYAKKAVMGLKIRNHLGHTKSLRNF